MTSIAINRPVLHSRNSAPSAQSRPGILRRFANALVKAREAEARLHAARDFRTYDANTLFSCGHDGDEIVRSSAAQSASLPGTSR